MDLRVKEIKVKDDQVPEAPHERLLKHPCTLGVIAPKGSGKTTLLCNMLGFYKKYFHKIIVISPTVKNDPKWETVQEWDLQKENKPLQKALKKLEEKGLMTMILPDLKKKGDPTKKFDGRIPKENFIEELDPDRLQDFMDEQQELVDFLLENGLSRWLSNRVLFIFDDIVGSDLLGSRRDEAFKIFNTRLRHLNFSGWMISQAHNEIPKTIRTQYSGLILFEIANEKELKSIYEEQPCGLTWEQWMMIYRLATKEDHSFLFFNLQKKKKDGRISKNFTDVIHVHSREDDDEDFT
jgi:hypothetical protein